MAEPAQPPGDRVGAIILVGGRSSRMGRDKARVEVDGRPMLDRVLTAIREALGEGAPVFVVAAPEQNIASLAASVSVVRDARAHAGPALGLLHGLEAADEAEVDRVYLAAVDHARLDPANVRDTVERLRAAPPSTWAALPVIDGHARPLASAVRVGPALVRCRAVAARPDARARSARAVFEGEGVARFVPARPEALRSHDRPEDVADPAD